jgi:hypothetical protein
MVRRDATASTVVVHLTTSQQLVYAEKPAASPERGPLQVSNAVRSGAPHLCISPLSSDSAHTSGDTKLNMGLNTKNIKQLAMDAMSGWAMS